MPRTARIKPDDVGTYYHCTNRVVGEEGDFPFGDVEKETFIRLIREATQYFTIEVLSYQILDNHWHIVCYAPAELLSPEESAKRFNDFYAGRKPVLTPDDPYCDHVAHYIRDVGCFIGWIQQRFTSWFNKTRARRRRGTVWAGRFKSTILERDTALWECLCYVEMNAVRAGIVTDPAEYRFGSWGQWCGTGQHPFGDNLRLHLAQYEGSQARDNTLAEIRKHFRTEIVRRRAYEKGAVAEEIEEAVAAASKSPGFALCISRRVRYWSDGLVIGAEKFVVDMAARCYGRAPASQHRPKRAKRYGESIGLWAYRHLRSVAPHPAPVD
jgi:hypothetical protein